MTTVLSLFALALGAAHVRVQAIDPARRGSTLRPAASTMILLVAVSSPPTTPPGYQLLVTFGLFFIVVGDVFLMLPPASLVVGLSGFLVAPVFFAVAFSLGTTFDPLTWTMVPVVAVVVGMVMVLSTRAGELAGLVIVYGLVVLAAFWRGLERYQQVGDDGALLACAGATLLVVSGAALATHRFVAHYRGAQAAITVPYFLGHWAIALSV